MSIVFPYETKRIEEGLLIDPRVTLDIATPRGFLSLKFLVDSGADVTTLPLLPYGELFQFRKNPRDAIRIGGIEGKGVSGYPFRLKVKLHHGEFSLRCYFIESVIDPLLGRLDFWKLFSISFDNKRLQTVFIPL